MVKIKNFSKKNSKIFTGWAMLSALVENAVNYADSLRFESDWRSKRVLACKINQSQRESRLR